MSSGPPPEVSSAPSPDRPAANRRRRFAGRLRRPAGWSLRARLIVELLGLLALVCLLIGVVTEIALRQFLIGQLDSQLQAIGGRSAAAAPEPPPAEGEGPAPNFLLAPGHSVGTLGAELSHGQVERAGVLTSAGAQAPVPKAEQSVLVQLPADGQPHTRRLGSLGDYRLLASRRPGGDIVVTGLPLAGVEATLVGLGIIMGAVAVAALVATGLAGALIVRATLRPLRRVATTAARVVEVPLDRGEVALSVRVPEADTDPGTEVGQVGAALNRMLGHVAAALSARQASETRVRQFVANASHELRTPLAAIRGYAELSRRGGDRVPPAVAHAMERVESESARMTTLVEELLLLARLDSGRPAARQPVDVSRLVAEAVTDGHVRSADHRWLMELPEEPVIVTGDAGQLQQVMANLLSNAHTHTPPGTTVTTGLTVGQDGEVTVTVVDDGPGIAPDLLPEVFERFVRGDTSRARATGSTGLGLSIVAAVVAAHGGRIGVTSRPGETRFIVTLPAGA